MIKIMDGNEACSHIALNFTEVAGIYPITPSSTMAEYIDKWSNEGKKNIFGITPKVVEMQSEKGAIGLVHGALQSGTFATTFTSSQGLLLMIPNMYKIAGEMLPCVINVAARTVATHALSILGDHSDIYAIRQTGFAMLSSSSVQQVMDLTSVSYLSSVEGRIPFVNFFDGFRTSHEMQKINTIESKDLKKLINYDKIDEFRNRALDIDNPTTRGTNQSDQIYFQNVEARNKYYNALPDIVNEYMDKINSIQKTNYKPFNYYGSVKADRIIIAMGSVCETIKETVDYLNSKGNKVGLVEVHLYRPFSPKYLLSAIPKTVKSIAVLDRTKEPGSNGEPLYLDVVEVLSKVDKKIKVIGGRYGLSSKNTTPNDIEAVYNFLAKNDNFSGFTIGICDDVTNLSLKKTTTIFNSSMKEVLIYGFGSDGMVTCSKDILKIIGTKTNNYVQGYFEYDSKKSNGVTKSHLRFDNKPIRSTYYVENPSLVVCTKDSYLKKYNILKGIKANSSLILNTDKNEEDLKDILTKDMTKIIKDKNLNFYIIDANSISSNNNIPNKISSIMELVILKIMNTINYDDAYTMIKESITTNFSKKGQEIVNSNLSALDEAANSLKKVNIESIKGGLCNIVIENSVFSKLDHLEGNSLKVSDFVENYDGVYEGGLSKYEKRGLSTKLPCYDKEKCIMCNLCSFVCPHSVIRPYLINKKELKKAPKEVKDDLIDAKIKDKDLSFTIGVSTYDCTGCSLCANVCPTHALTMKDKNEVLVPGAIKNEFLISGVDYKDIFPINTVKGVGFKKPLFEFHGACAGCGETPYIRLLTQLFGDNMIIANATGCSSIYGASLPNTPYTVPWVNSLFEDNAEFGLGIKISDLFMKNQIKEIMNQSYDKASLKNKRLINLYLNKYNKENSYKVYNELDFSNIKKLEPLKKYIKEKSVWIVGGDGWAYDIGFDGIDHVLASGENVNILVLDTEVYSNTGGQASKSTRVGAIAKFATNGKQTAKKDLAKFALSYPNVYVGTVSLGANYNQTIKTFIEAEAYDGPSIIIAYAPCIAHGIKKGMQTSIAKEKEVVQTGYFPLFRYSPETKEFKLESDANFDSYEEIFNSENRYSLLKDDNEQLKQKNKKNAQERYEYYKSLTK